MYEVLTFEFKLDKFQTHFCQLWSMCHFSLYIQYICVCAWIRPNLWETCGAVKGINRNTFWMWIWIRKHFFKSIFLILFCLVTLLSLLCLLSVPAESSVWKAKHITIYVFIIASDGMCPKPKEGPQLVGLHLLWQLMPARATLLIRATTDVVTSPKNISIKRKKKKTISKDMAQEFVWVLFIGGQCHIKCLTILGGFKQPQELQVCGQFKRKMDKKNRDINRCTRVKKTKTHNKHTYRMIFLV